VGGLEGIGGMMAGMRQFLILMLVLGGLVPAADAGGSRSGAMRAAFVRANPCPETGQRRGSCPGWVVDHVIALECGGADHPSNMQWQTVADARAKDKWERRGCSRRKAQ
jgi:hypothetical protein